MYAGSGPLRFMPLLAGLAHADAALMLSRPFVKARAALDRSSADAAYAASDHGPPTDHLSPHQPNRPCLKYLDPVFVSWSACWRRNWRRHQENEASLPQSDRFMTPRRFPIGTR